LAGGLQGSGFERIGFIASVWRSTQSRRMEHKVHVVDTSTSPYAKIRPVPIEAVKLEDGFWAPRQRTLRERTIPTQYNLCEETGRISNFRRASGKEAGDFQGYFFNDSDIYKWIEAAAFSLAAEPNEELRDLVERVVDDIAAAQDVDGYLDTYFTFERKKERWTNLQEMHELYCHGHMFQAAIALYRSTGGRKLLDVASRAADNIAYIFSTGKRNGTPGHPEIEMALVELYRMTGKRTYLQVAKALLDNRGRGVVGGGQNLIDHKQFRELEEIVGHSVRSLYLNCGATDIYMETGEKALWGALDRLWRSLVERRMYVTGGAGARYDGEAFGVDFELPDAMAYAETCAAIANVMWNWRMFLATGDARYVDVLELALYNGALSGISLDGKRYFYVNPLANRGDHRRQEWFPCACCPPNIARLLASLQGYAYGVSEREVWVNLYAQSGLQVKFSKAIRIEQRTEYPWQGDVTLAIEPEAEADFGLNMRMPGWCGMAELELNGQRLETSIGPNRFITLRRTWSPGDVVRLALHMPVERIESNPRVDASLGRIALRRGPLIYCIEQVDNRDFDVWDLVVPTDALLAAEWEPNLLNGVMVIRGEGLAFDSDWQDRRLYRPPVAGRRARRVKFSAIPYYAWANREPGPMTIWVGSQGTPVIEG